MPYLSKLRGTPLILAPIVGSLLPALFISAGAQTAPPQAAAPTATLDDVGLTEVVITANKRAEDIKDVPNSVLAITQDSLERANVHDFDDLLRIAPSVTITKTTQPANNSINIRGIGTYSFSIATQPSTAVVVDDIPQAFQAEAFTSLTDVQQVEILRGPQSTLFGKSATAGVINITTVGPTDTFGVKAEAMVTTDEEETVQASVTGPLADGLKVRLSGNFSDYRGNLHNLTTASWLDGDNDWTWRGNIVWQPTSAWSFTLLPYVITDRASCCAQADYFLSPGVTFSKSKLPVSLILQGITPGPDNTLLANSVNAKGDSYDVGSGFKAARLFANGLTLMEIASYDHYTLHDNQSTDLTSYDFSLIAPTAPHGGSGNGGYFAVNSVTEELRLTSPDAGALRYVGGLYYSDSITTRNFVRGSDTLGNFNGLASLPTTNSTTYATYLDHSDIQTYALYGQATYDLTKRLSIVGGLRLHHEDVSYNFLDRLHDINFGYPACSSVNPVATLKAETCNDDTVLLEKGAIQYHFTPDLMVFADYATGYKGLAYDLTSTLTLQTPITSGALKGIPTGDAVASHQPIQPERSRDYEAGFKGEFWAHRIAWNLTGFWEEFTGFQAQNRDSLTGQNVLESIGKVTSAGAESELAARPIPDLTLALNGAYDIAKIATFPSGPCYADQTVALGCSNAVQNLSGKPLPNAPKWTFDVNANYEHTLIDNLSGFFGVSYRWQSQVLYALTQDPTSFQPSFGILNVSTGLSGEHWKATVFVDNVCNRLYAIDKGRATQYNISPYAAPFTDAVFWTPGRDSFRYAGLKLAVNY